MDNQSKQNEMPLALIVEDEDLLAELFAVAFEEAGYQTETARDGQQALDLLANITPHIVLLDIHLPYVSGEEVFYEMKKIERLAETKVIMATADVRKAKEMDGKADMVLVKPVGFRDLNTLIEDMRPAVKD
ncbi:MAG: response regulator [Anaerolineae bacterium]|nr:response regulator [Anaerolineae bacterium]